MEYLAVGHLSAAIRPLQPDDLDRMYDIDRLSFPDYAVFERASYDALLTDPAFYCRVAVDEINRVLAYLLIKTTPKPALVFSIAVHPSRRTYGLGGALLRQYLDEWPGTVRAFVEVGDAKSIAFYERFGFARTEEHSQEGDAKLLMVRKE